MTEHQNTPRMQVNSTYEARLIALIDEGAVVELGAPLPSDAETILTIGSNGGDAVHLPARIVRSFIHAGRQDGLTEHYSALEFLALPHRTAAALRQVINGMAPDACQFGLLSDAVPARVAITDDPR